jgi:hypothetical protein
MVSFQSLPSTELTTLVIDLDSSSMVAKTILEQKSGKLHLLNIFLTLSNILTTRVCCSTSSSDLVDSYESSSLLLSSTASSQVYSQSE